MTLKNEKMKTYLIPGLIVVLLVSSTGVVFGEPQIVTLSKTDSLYANMDTTDYLSQAQPIFKEIVKVKSEVDSISTQLQSIGNSSDMLQTRQNELKQQLNSDQSLMASDVQELKKLEQKNIKSYQVDSKTEKRLLDAEKAIKEKYNVDQNDPINNNPVQQVYADSKFRNIVVMLDPDMVDGNSFIAKDANGNLVHLDALSIQAVEPNLDIPVKTEFGKFNLASCSSTTNGICTPLVGGVSISMISNVPNSLNTVGYRAFIGQQAGFVIAGHTIKTLAEFNANVPLSQSMIGRQIVQPYTSSNVIGPVTAVGFDSSGHPYCDCAFVAVNGQTLNNIFINGVTQTAITFNKPSSQQVVGSFVYKSGASSGISMGQVTTQPTPTIVIAGASLSSAGGDSGSPVFSDYTGTTASLNGMIIRSAGSASSYQAWDWIQQQINTQPN